MSDSKTTDDAQQALDPSCPQRLWTGWAGALTIACGAVWLTFSRCFGGAVFHSGTRYVLLLVLGGVIMAVVELAAFRAHRHQFDFGRRRRLTRADHRDVFRQYGALILSLMVAWGAYKVFAEYGLRFGGFFSAAFEKSWYRPFFFLLQAGTIFLGVAALPYLYLCAGFRRWAREDDELLRLWNGYVSLMHGGRPEAGFAAAVRSFLVKFYFIPVMTVFFVNNAAAFEREFMVFLAAPWGWNVTLAGKLFRASYEGLFLVDVGLALLGYICCLRLLDTHIRSAEPTLLGWVVALACYPPFNYAVTGRYIPADAESQSWCQILGGIPWLYYPVGAVILVLLAVYVYATMAFGLRFSNLTHRGILCRGPYA